MDWSKVCRIGIDRIVLSQFEAKKLPNFCINSKNIIEGKHEFYWEENDLFHISLKTLFNESGEKVINKISFNPNKILMGHNITNSRKEEIEKIIDVLTDKLKNDFGVEINLLNSNIKEIEINNNLVFENNDFKMIFEAIQDGYDVKFEEQIKNGKRKKSKAYTERDNEKRVDIKDNIWMPFESFVIRVYNKTKKVNNQSLLSEPLTRFEITLKKAYRDNIKKLGLSSSLKDLIENINIIDNMFMFYIEKYIFGLGLFEIERFKKNAEREYLQYKKFGKDQEVQGIIRSVYDSIKNKKYIFDYIFIIDLVKKYDSKHKGREIKRAVNTLKEFKNLTKFNYLVDYFFAPQSPKCGENKKIQVELAKLKVKELERILIEK